MSLQTAVKGYSAGTKEAIEEHWYHTGKDGSLSIDEKVLQSADVDTLKKVLMEILNASKISFVMEESARTHIEYRKYIEPVYIERLFTRALEMSNIDFWG